MSMSFKLAEILSPEDLEKLEKAREEASKRDALKKKRQMRSIPKHKRRFMNLE